MFESANHHGAVSVMGDLATQGPLSIEHSCASLVLRIVLRNVHTDELEWSHPPLDEHPADLERNRVVDVGDSVERRGPGRCADSYVRSEGDDLWIGGACLTVIWGQVFL